MLLVATSVMRLWVECERCRAQRVGTVCSAAAATRVVCLWLGMPLGRSDDVLASLPMFWLRHCLSDAH